MGMQKFSHQHFGLCILAFDAAHVVAAGFFGVDVCHFVKVGIALSFALMQKKQKIKEDPIAPRVFPCLRSAKAFNNICLRSGYADLLYPVCRGGFYRGVYSGIYERGFKLASFRPRKASILTVLLMSISGLVFLALISLILHQ